MRAVLSHSRQDHLAMFPSDTEELAATAAGFLREVMQAGGVGIVVATGPHRRRIERQLADSGIDLAVAAAKGSYIVLDAALTMRSFMVNGWADPAAFYRVISPVLKKAGRHRRAVHVFSEMVALLWEAEQYSAALDVEALWTEMGKQHRFDLLCAYPEAPAGGARDDELELVLCAHRRTIGSRQPQNQFQTA